MSGTLSQLLSRIVAKARWLFHFQRLEKLGVNNALVLTLTLGIAALLGGSICPRPAWGEEELFVPDLGNNSVTVYSRTASGNTAPIRTLSGAATGLSSPIGLTVDRVNNELLVANIGNNSITVYSRTASGNTAPIRTLSGAATGLNGPEGLAVDTVNGELVVANFSGSSVTVYSRTASGNAAPART